MQQQELFVSGEQGYFSYRIPALVTTNSDTILAFCEARRHNGHDDDEIDILLRRSFDNGLTWGAPQMVVADGDRTCGNPCPVVDAETDTIFLPFCKDNQQIFACHSTDDGETWSTPVEITATAKDPAWSYVGTGPGHGIQLQSGRLLIPSWADESPGPVTWRQPTANWGKVQSAYAIYSDDHGESWQRGARMDRDASDECEAVETADGAVYMNMRSRQDRLCRAESWSRDGGTTWSAVEYDPALPEPSCQGSIVRYDAGRILLAHPSFTDRRAGLTVRLSRDECRSWPVARVLEPETAAYSDLAVSADGHILCFYEARKNYGALTLAHFDIQWLEEGA
jgi:sialidase-1